MFDDFEDVYTMRPDGTEVVNLTAKAGSEFDGAWSPDGQSVVYRDSRRGINEDDEIYIVRADGTGARNLTNDPANDWGPDWSSDGEWIVFNSDRGGGALGGYVVRPDGSDLRRLPIDGWVEYATFSPDGTRIAFMSHVGSDYDTSSPTSPAVRRPGSPMPADRTGGRFGRRTERRSPSPANATTAPGCPTTSTAGTATSPANTTTSGSWAPTARTNAA